MTEYSRLFSLQINLKRHAGLLLFGASFLAGSVSADVITGEEVQTGLRTWEWREGGVSIQLVQRLPDQTRAFFQARGFDSEEADTIGRACVFQTIFRNDGRYSLAYNLDDWQIRYQGTHRPLLTRERWETKWPQRGVNQAAHIALRWSLLPTRQGFEPGDYNWGMTSFGLPPGEVFDLNLVIVRQGDPVSGTIPDIVCAEDQTRSEP